MPAILLKDNSPAIVVQDMDWESETGLIGFEVTGEGTLDNANLRVPAELWLRFPDGSEVKRKVVYVVGTDPVIIVFRESY